MIIFIKAELIDRVFNIDCDVVKLGAGGQLGNKGALIITFKFDDTSFAFTNCHLEAG